MARSKGPPKKEVAQVVGADDRATSNFKINDSATNITHSLRVQRLQERVPGLSEAYASVLAELAYGTAEEVFI